MDADAEVLEAVRARDLDRLRRALNASPAAARARDESGLSALTHAVYGRFRDGVTLLRDAGGLTTIHEAAALGDAERVQQFLGEARNLADAVGPDGAAPLHLAAHFGHGAVIRLLVDQGADPTMCTEHGFSNTPLHAAAAGRQADAVRLLVDAGVDVDARDRNGYTALHIAAAGGARNLVEVLLAAGADAAVKGPHGKTPREVALERDADDVLDLLAA